MGPSRVGFSPSQPVCASIKIMYDNTAKCSSEGEIGQYELDT